MKLKKLFAKISPKVKLRKGSPQALLYYLITPLTEFEIEGGTLLESEHLMKKHKNILEKIRNKPFKTYSLFAKGKKR
jgi:hypothetical protein